MNDIEDKLRAQLLLALNGNNAAYAGFLTRCSVHLRAYFRRRLAAFPDDVEDLVQETLLALHNQRNTYRPSQPLTPWLYVAGSKRPGAEYRSMLAMMWSSRGGTLPHAASCRAASVQHAVSSFVMLPAGQMRGSS